MIRKRCAIYTRKSTDEGLDQTFNSLDAQKEACDAYITSQLHEGWQLVRKVYDDGGFSGGSMDRPALKDLMKDVCRLDDHAESRRVCRQQIHPPAPASMSRAA